MLVRVERAEKTQAVSLPQTAVRVHSAIGTAVVSWHGDPDETDGQHHVEWTVDEDLHWGENIRLSALAEPWLGQDGNHVILRGRINVSEADIAVLEVEGSLIMFGLAAPLPEGIAAPWVEIRVAAAGVSLYPVQL
ncbi:hypothetical protein [Streptomyces hiroshimensis]|uniref:Uncharacterized protein n=1 Tax=Streptomyces hiroshimensis TaxID=66424 RepID=A0ABQ2Y8W2_9ACTN|nr:hypothetical protein [Streptomyces hiroshimensis]GGX75771.1 hypothetical protein GCM10010324_21590 [Streptomyces hiroshimensis]